MTPQVPAVELNIHTPKEPVEATIVENRIVTKSSSPNYIRHITFDISGTQLAGRLRAGQSIGILAPGEDENGKPHKVRLYSLSSPTAGEAGNPNLVSTTVKRAVDEVEGRLYTGVCSNYLSDRKPGDRVRITGPSGKRFLLPENPRDWNYIFFATGTGIAPFRGMALDLFPEAMTLQGGSYPAGAGAGGGSADPYKNHCAVVFGCPYRTDLLYSSLFESLAAQNSHFSYRVSVSREGVRPDGSRDYVQTKILDASEGLGDLLAKPNTLIYLCGLKGMESGIYRALLKAGHPEYLDLRGDLPSDPDAVAEEEFRRLVKPGERVFEEVY